MITTFLHTLMPLKLQKWLRGQTFSSLRGAFRGAKSSFSRIIKIHVSQILWDVIAMGREKLLNFFCHNFIVKKCYLKKIIMFIACETKLCSPQANFFEILGEKTRKWVFSYEILIAPSQGGQYTFRGHIRGQEGLPLKGAFSEVGTRYCQVSVNFAQVLSVMS